jgi:TonB family protein
MSSEGRGVSDRGEEAAGTPRIRSEVLRGCLVDGDAEQSRRERTVRRRALILSTLLQALVLLAVIALPFFGKAERIALANVTPLSPYCPLGNAAHEQQLRTAPPSGGRATFCLRCPVAPPTRPSSTGNVNNSAGVDGIVGIDGMGDSNGPPCVGCVLLGNSEGPRPPEPATPHVVKVTHIDPAMLIMRVEPAYPPLARQIRREGRVELHAMIAADGTIEQLEAVSGDVLFYPSAMDAVRRWRYRPTILNGTAVKVDTYITVIYTLQQ